MESYWDVHRDTWMQQRGVCTLGKEPTQRDDCSVYVTRVVGQATGVLNSPEWAFLEEDKIELRIKENMDMGKTFYMLHALSRAVPWATHIAKMDLDAYPYIYNLVSSLHSKQKCAPAYQWMGRPLRAPKSDLCSGEPWVFNDTLRSHNNDVCTDGQCAASINLQYMQGGMYILSRSLAHDVTELDGFYFKNKVGPEDKCLGEAITHRILYDSRQCMSVWYHHNEWYHRHRDGPWIDPHVTRGELHSPKWYEELARRCVYDPELAECVLPEREESFGGQRSR